MIALQRQVGAAYGVAGTPRGEVVFIDKMATIVSAAYLKSSSQARPRNFLPARTPGERVADYWIACRAHSGHAIRILQARLAQPTANPARRQVPTRRSVAVITQPVLVANGDHDLTVDSSHSADLRLRRLPSPVDHLPRLRARRSVPAPRDLRAEEVLRSSPTDSTRNSQSGADSEQRSPRRISSITSSPPRPDHDRSMPWCELRPPRNWAPGGGVPVVFPFLAANSVNQIPRSLTQEAENHRAIGHRRTRRRPQWQHPHPVEDS